MRSSIIVPVIATLLLVGYIVAIRALLSRRSFISVPSYRACRPISCGNSILQYPFGACGLLRAYCAGTNQNILLAHSPFSVVVRDIRNSSYSNRTLQISLNPEDGDTTYMYSWLNATTFFNVSTVPGGMKITWSISDRCRSCLATGGRCYSYFDDDSISNEDECICPNNELHFSDCTDGLSGLSYTYEENTSPGLMAAIFFGEFGAFIILVVSCIVFHRGCCCKRTESDEERTILEFMDPLGSTPPTVENFLNYYSSQVPTRYSYAQIRIYTNNLAEQLGKGGFGTVYKGKLPSGRLIAVKILDESKQSEQQFIAEVGTVGSTYHVNLVRMLGFCSEGTKRALVYEFMVNGSLEKYIHGNHQDQLDWKQLYSIAIGTARGILYLHDECRNRILHCDIKPHNVLLDANFLPKIADFGLAKISRREEGHISAAHGGTLGYAVPKMWSRIYGPVTDRSDVYSYGMLIMEMVGGERILTLII